MSEYEVAKALSHYGTPRDYFFGQEEKVQRYTQGLESSRGLSLGLRSRVEVVAVEEPLQDPCNGCPLEDVLLQPGRLLHFMKHRNGGQLGGVYRH